MSAASEKPRNKRIKLVGGGVRWRRSRAPDATGSGGSLKAQRRKLRQTLKTKKRDMTVADRKAIKEQIAQLLAQKDWR